MHITGCLSAEQAEAEEKKEVKQEIAFVFHANEKPFQETKRITVEKDEFEAAKLVADLNSTEDGGCLIIAMFTSVRVKAPAKIVKLFRQKSSSDTSWIAQCVTPAEKWLTSFKNVLVANQQRILLMTED